MMERTVLVVCLSPAFQQTYTFSDFKEDEVNRSQDVLLAASGKGVNVCRVLGRLGCNPVNLTLLGGPRISEFLDFCRLENIRTRYVDSHVPIRTCVTIINGGKHTSTEVVEETKRISTELNAEILICFKEELGNADAVILTGTMPSGASENLMGTMVGLAKERNKLIVLDIRNEALLRALPFRPDIIKPNLQEFMQTFYPSVKIYENSDSECLFDKVSAKCGQLYEKYNVKTIITRGKFDSWFFDGVEMARIPSKKVEVVNTIGCGDTFTANLVNCLLDGLPLHKSVKNAMDQASERASRKLL